MSKQFVKQLSRPLAALSVALLVNIGSASAASGGGVEQMRDVLAGHVTSHASPSAAVGGGAARGTGGQAQEFAARLLAGPHGSATREAPAPSAAPQGRAGLIVRGDAQAMAQRLLLRDSGVATGS